MQKPSSWLGAITMVLLALSGASQCLAEVCTSEDCPPDVFFQMATHYQAITVAGRHHLRVTLCGNYQEYRQPLYTSPPYCCQDFIYGASIGCGLEQGDNFHYMHPRECWSNPQDVTDWWDTTQCCAYPLYKVTWVNFWTEEFDTTNCGPGQTMLPSPDHNNYNCPPAPKGEPEELVGLRAMPGTEAEDTLHDFGDTLCFEFEVTADSLPVTLELSASTYQGRAMNYPVNDSATTELDTISDLVPIEADGWSLVDQWFEGDRSHFRLQQNLYKGCNYVCLRVLDYAAEGDLTAHRSDYYDYDLCCPQQIPRNYNYWKSPADPDSDGFTIWEEYRGFCDSTAAHFRLDLDTVAANTKRQIIVIDDDDLLDYSYTEDLIPRLQEMMKCSLLVDCNVQTDTVRNEDDVIPGIDWNYYDRIDTYQAAWDGTDDSWVPNPLTDPHYDHRAPADSTGMVRSSDQVAIRLSMQDLSGFDNGNGTFGAAGITCRIESGESDWDYGLCAVSGIGIDTNLIWNTIHNLWSRRDYVIGLEDHYTTERNVMTVARRRTIAHELGHIISVLDHVPEFAGDYPLCVMMNDILWVKGSFPDSPAGREHDPQHDEARDSWWNEYFVLQFRDDPDNPNPEYKWGYKDDIFHCKRHIFYRPPLRSNTP